MVALASQDQNPRSLESQPTAMATKAIRNTSHFTGQGMLSTGGLLPSVAARHRKMPIVRLQVRTAADVRAVGGYEKRQHDFRGRSPAVRKHLVVGRPVAEMLGLRDHRPVFEPLFHESPFLMLEVRGWTFDRSNF
jgi:hypothetical protein